jgi:hypothetical protein
MVCEPRRKDLEERVTHWILQNNLYSEEGFESLTGALDRLGSLYSIHKCIPFVGTLEPEAEPPPGPVIVMGSYTLANHAKARGWTPGAWLDNLDFQIQREHWGDHMLNADAHICTFGSIPFQIKPFFLRPVHDTKSFTGFVCDWGYYTTWRAGIERMGPEPDFNLDTLVMLCTKKEIYTETRCWVVDGEIVTSSGYKMGTLKRYSPPEAVDPDILTFASHRANDWSPNQAYVMDVAETPDGLKIVEINNLNSAGFYKADMNKLVMRLENIV